MSKLFFTLIFVISCSSLFAQDEYAVDFLWQVKHVNEFIDRFNNNDSTLLKQYYLKFDSTLVITRKKLIRSLFNAEKKDWNYPEIDTFIKLADDKEKPQLLSLFGDKWAASATCSVIWKGKPQSAVLTLKLLKLPNNTCKWIITDVEARFLKTTVYNTPFRMPAAVDSTTSLNPVSHTTDFMDIDQVSRDKINIANYFIQTDNYTNETMQFIQECLNGHLQILQVNTVSYNFTQINGWAFEIKQYNRRSRNSGWLISKLTKTASD